jgi:hypothetical protein
LDLNEDTNVGVIGAVLGRQLPALWRRSSRPQFGGLDTWCQKPRGGGNRFELSAREQGGKVDGRDHVLGLLGPEAVHDLIAVADHPQLRMELRFPDHFRHGLFPLRRLS